MAYICYLFFIHSSGDGYLGWFNFLASVNSATVNMDVNPNLSVSYKHVPLVNILAKKIKDNFFLMNPVAKVLK